MRKLTKKEFLSNAKITKESEKITGENYLSIEIFDDLFYLSEDGIFTIVPAYLKRNYLKYNSLVKFA